MKILEVALHTIVLPVISPLINGVTTHTERHTLIVELTAEVDGELVSGWGECGVPLAPVCSSEYLDGVIAVTTEHLLPRLVRASAVNEIAAEAVADMLGEVVGHRMAKAAIEMAVLDAQLRAAGMSFKSYLGVTGDRVPSGVSVGIHDSIPHLLDTVSDYIGEGYQRMKLEIRPGWDLEPVRAVREAYPGMTLQVDARSAYTPADAEHLARLDAFNLLLIERPLGKDALRHHALLAQRMTTPVCLGDSIVSATSAEDAIAWGSAAIIRITPSRAGGYLEARRIHDVALAHGTPVWCGGAWETGFARAANVALAGMPGFTLTGDVPLSSPFSHRDIADPSEVVDGHVLVPDVPGLAPQPRRQRLAEATVSTVRLGF